MALLGLDTPRKVAVFFGYIVLWCWIRAYIYFSTHAGPGFPQYDRAAVVTAVSVCKLILAAGFFLATDGSLSDLARQTGANLKLFGKYFGLSVLYAGYDNLTFAVLALLSPFTYQVLMQLRLVVTALLWQLLFQKRLGIRQWGAVLLISVSIALFNLLDTSNTSNTPSKSDIQDADSVAAESALVDNPALVAEIVARRTFGVALALVQIVCTVLAGIACEYFLKDKKSSGVSINLQNCFMYSSSIVVNVLVSCFAGQGDGSMTISPFATAVFHWQIFFPLVLPMAAAGLVTSLVLKELDSVRKSIAAALEIVGDLAVSAFVFGQPTSVLSVVLGGTIVFSVIVYSTSARVDRPALSEKDSEDKPVTT